MDIITVSKNNFDEEVIKSTKTVLVDFWASWCMPCKMMLPVVEAVAKEIGDDVKIAKINVDEEPELASRYGIMSIPTFLVFKNGNVTNMTVGMQDKQEILKLIK